MEEICYQFHSKQHRGVEKKRRMKMINARVPSRIDNKLAPFSAKL